MKKKFNISGMGCAACSSAVTKKVSDIKGVNFVNVNLLANNMVVDFDESQIGSKDIIDGVRSAGFDGEEDNDLDPYLNLNIGKLEIRNLRFRFYLSLLFMIFIMLISNFYIFPFEYEMPIKALLLVPMIIINIKYYKVGFSRLFKRMPNMDSLISIGSLFSIVGMYFDSAAMILTFVTFGKLLESRAKIKTTDAVDSLIALRPDTANVIGDEAEIQVLVKDVKVGDIVAVRAGEYICLDGKVVSGNAYVDESSLTGESLPIGKKIGDTVLSGTINTSGYFTFEVEKIGNDTSLSKIIALTIEAGSSKAKVERLVDKVSRVFVPSIMIISFITFFVWYLSNQDILLSLKMAIAVLVVACPCALGLATPVAVMVASGLGAKNSILIKNVEALESAKDIDIVVFDKTGTLTIGSPEVSNITSNIDGTRFLEIIASLENLSEHPLAKAVVKYATNEGIHFEPVDQLNTEAGMGISGIIECKKYFAGNKKFLLSNNIEVDSQDESSSVIYLGDEDLNFIGSIYFLDLPKKNSFAAVKELKNKGIKTILLSGDNKKSAEYIGNKLSLDEVISEVLPKDKVFVIQQLQDQGYKVAMVGDGINDAPALIKADIGISIGNATDIAVSSADVVLVSNDPKTVPKVINLGRRMIRTIQGNLFWAFCYNVILIPFAAGLFYKLFGIPFEPGMAAFAMSLSSIFVVTNALRLRNKSL